MGEIAFVRADAQKIEELARRWEAGEIAARAVDPEPPVARPEPVNG